AAPTAHATSHKSGGSDAIALDTLAVPTDITTLNVSTTAHGLAPKAPNDATKVLRGDGLFGTLLYSALGSIPTSFSPSAHAATHASGGSDPIALDALGAPTDITTLNASTTAHGLLRKLDNTATHYLDGTGVWSTPAGGATGPAGPAGPAGVNAYTVTAVSSFTVPNVGATTTVTVADASWIVVGQLLYFDVAGGGAGLAGALQVTAKAGNVLTLLNPIPPTGGGGDMTKAVYDANADNIVDHAALAVAAPWPGATGTPSTFAP